MSGRRSRRPGRETCQLIFEVWGGRCAYCAGPADHLDHVVPASRGGRHAAANRLPACQTCGLAKGARTLAEWMEDVAGTSCLLGMPAVEAA